MATQLGEADDVVKRVWPWLLARVAAVTPVVLIAVLVAVLAWWLDDKQLVLDYLKTLVWPLVVGTVLWWVRQPLRDKLADLLEVSAGGATAKFTQQQSASHKLEEGIAHAASELVGDHPTDGADAETHPQQAEGAPVQPYEEPASSVSPMTPPSLATAGADAGQSGNRNPATDELVRKVMADAADRESKRRAAVEKVIRESAEWGYNMARIGFQGTPDPVIQWDRSGRPQILYARSGENAGGVARHGLVVRGPSDSPTVKNLEAELQRLERERAVLHTKPINSLERLAEENVIDAQIERFRQQLRAIAPNSPWGLR